MNPKPQPTNTEPLEDDQLPCRVSLQPKESTAGAASSSGLSCLKASTTSQQDNDMMSDLKAEIARLRKANQDLERKVQQSPSSGTSGENKDDDDASKQQQQLGLHKCDEVLNLKHLAGPSSDSLSSSSSDKSSPSSSDKSTRRRRSADRKKIARLESHLLETQRRSQETQSLLEAKLDRALESNRVLRERNSLELDEMQSRIQSLEYEIETEEWCNAVVGWMCDDMEKNRRHDKLSMVRSHCDGMMRERDDKVRGLEEACERKDHAVETLTSELKGAKEEVRRLKLAEAARLASQAAQMPSKQLQLGEITEKTSGFLPRPNGALRRNSAHATCA